MVGPRALSSPFLLALSYPAVFVAAGLESCSRAGRCFAPATARFGSPSWFITSVLVASFLGLYFACTVDPEHRAAVGLRWGYWRESFPPWARALEAAGLADRSPRRQHAGLSDRRRTRGKHGDVDRRAWRASRYCGERPADLRLRLLLSPFAYGTGRGRSGPISLRRSPSDHSVPGAVDLPAGRPRSGGALASRLPSPMLAARALLETGGRLSGGHRLLSDRRDLVRALSRLGGSKSAADSPGGSGPQTAATPTCVCVKSDLGLDFQPQALESGMSAVYLFHRGMYAHPHARREIRRSRSGTHWPDGRSAWSSLTSFRAATPYLSIG